MEDTVINSRVTVEGDLKHSRKAATNTPTRNRVPVAMVRDFGAAAPSAAFSSMIRFPANPP